MLRLSLHPFPAAEGTATGGGSSRRTAPAEPPADAPKTIPYARFHEVTTELDTTKTALTEAQKLAPQLEEATGTIAKLQEELALTRSGVTDPEDADLVRYHYGRLQGDAKPKTIVEYTQSLTAEGAVVPRGLQHIFAPKSASDTTVDDKSADQPPNTTPARKPMPKVGSDGKRPTVDSAVSAEQIRAARIDAAQTRNYKKLTELMELVK